MATKTPDLRQRMATLLSMGHGDLALQYVRLEMAAQHVLNVHSNEPLATLYSDNTGAVRELRQVVNKGKTL